MRQSQSHLQNSTPIDNIDCKTTQMRQKKHLKRPPVLGSCMWKNHTSKWGKTQEVNAIALLWLQMTPPPVSLIFYPDFCTVGGSCDVTSSSFYVKHLSSLKNGLRSSFAEKFGLNRQCWVTCPGQIRKNNGSKWLMWHCTWVTLELSRDAPHNSAVFKICLIHQHSDSSETMSESYFIPSGTAGHRILRVKSFK